MKYLIWGGTGFIGKNIVDSLVKEKHEVINVSRKLTGNEAIATLSYDNEDMIVKELAESDGAIFAAGIRLSKEFSIDYYNENLKLLGKVLDLLNKAGQKNCIFLSTIGVYGDEFHPWKEDDNYMPSNLYALSKKHQDELIDWHNQRGMNFKVLRLAQVMGLGERKGYLFNTFLDTAYSKKPLTVMGTGLGSRQYIYIKDIVETIIKLLDKVDSRGIYNLGIDGSISIKDLAELMHEVFDIKENVQFVDYELEDLKIREMDTSKIKEELSIIPRFDVRAAICDLKKVKDDEHEKQR